MPDRRTAALKRLEDRLLARGRTETTVARYRSAAARLLAAAEVEDPADLQQEHVEAWLADMRRRQCQPRTLRLYASIAATFAKAIGGDFALETAPTVVAEIGHRPYFRAAEVGALITVARHACTLDDRALLAVSTTWGLRRVELAGMQAADLDVSGRRLWVRTAKRGAPRAHVLPEVLVPILEGWRPEVRHVGTLTERFHRICSVCRVTPPERGGWHSIRRALCSGLDYAGVPREALRSFMRWRGVTDTAGIYIMHDTAADDAAVLAKHPFLTYWEE